MKVILAIFLVFTALVAWGAPPTCTLVDSYGTIAWTPLSDPSSPSAVWMRANGTLTGAIKFSVVFNSQSGYVKTLHKITTANTFSESNIPFVADWSDPSILGPAKLIVVTPSGKCTYDFEVTRPAFESTQVPAPIPDMGMVNSTVSVSGVGTIEAVRVSFWIQHTNDADLDISLIGPDGTTVDLSSDNGGTGDNYGTGCKRRTIVEDGIISDITAGAAPFTAKFHPEQPLSAFAGKSGGDANGTWTLRVVDDTGGNTGQVVCWSLEIKD